MKQLFNQDPNYLHFSNFLVASHPRPVREAIERYRQQIDRNPGLAMDWDLQETWKREGQVREWAGRYLNATPAQIALTGDGRERQRLSPAQPQCIGGGGLTDVGSAAWRPPRQDL